MHMIGHSESLNLSFYVTDSAENFLLQKVTKNWKGLMKP